MTYRIGQDFSYAGNDYWRWSAWIEADDDELDKIKEVAWLLHPTFKQNRIVVKTRENGFRLEASGWGTFLLRAEIALANGKKKHLEHHLRLEYPETSSQVAPTRSAAAPKPGKPPTVYLSYSTEHARVASEVRAGLEKAGLEVLDQSRLGVGEPWSDKLRQMIAQSDAVLGLVGDEDVSPWVNAELSSAVASSKPAFVLAPPQASVAGLPGKVHMLTFDLKDIDVSKVATLLQSAGTLKK